MHDPTLSTASVSAAVQAIADRLSGGSLDLYDGPKPTSPGEAADRPFLARITLPSPAFVVGDVGSAELQGVPLSSLVVHTGDPTWARFSRPLRDGATAELDVTVGLADADPDLVIAARTLQVGSLARIVSFSLGLG